MITSAPGDHPDAVAEAGVDLYALTHNETSTGVAMQLAASGRRRRRMRWSPSTPRRPPAACDGTRPRSTSTTSPRRSASPATAGCGSRRVRRRRSNGSVGSPAASAGSRRRSISASRSTNSRADQTYNTPAVATLIMLDDQLRWMNDNGGLEWCAARSDESAAIMYGWADTTEWATPFVVDPAKRSSVVATIDLDPVGQRRRRVHRAARQRHRRHRRLPQARPQPAAGRHVPGDRTRPTSRRSPRASTRRRPPSSLTGWTSTRY